MGETEDRAALRNRLLVLFVFDGFRAAQQHAIGVRYEINERRHRTARASMRAWCHDGKEGPRMLSGSCLCARVRYEIDGKLGPVGHCHCVTCRKAQGGAFVTNAPVRLKYFRLLSGADTVAEYESSPGKKRCFCRNCGSPLWSRRASEPEVLRIRLGLLDSDPERRPLGHVWVSEKAPWYEITDALPQWPRGLDESATQPKAARTDETA